MEELFNPHSQMAASADAAPTGRFGSIRFMSISDSYIFGSVRFGSVRFGSVRFGSVRFGSGGSIRFAAIVKCGNLAKAMPHNHGWVR